jgi:hypothetical protein
MNILTMLKPRSGPIFSALNVLGNRQYPAISSTPFGYSYLAMRSGRDSRRYRLAVLAVESIDVVPLPSSAFEDFLVQKYCRRGCDSGKFAEEDTPGVYKAVSSRVISKDSSEIIFP